MQPEYKEFLMKTGKSTRTVEGYVKDMGHFERWFKQSNAEELSPTTLTEMDIREYRSFLMKVEKKSANTVNRRLAAIRSYTRWAEASGQTNQDIGGNIPSVAIQKRSPKWLTKKEQKAVLRLMNQDKLSAATPASKRLAVRNAAILTVFVHTGVRVEELCELTLEDVEITERKGRIHVIGKGEKERDIPLNLPARKALQEWLVERPQAETQTVFLGARKNGVTVNGVERMVRNMGKRAGVEVTPHILRHTLAKNLIDSGVSIEKVSSLLGHESLNTTRIYITPSYQDLENAVEGLYL